MHLKDLYRSVNLLREGLKLPPVPEGMFLVQISEMQVLGQITIENGMVRICG
jgi:excinuclease UvrABC helicase subunit UvrB